MYGKQSAATGKDNDNQSHPCLHRAFIAHEIFKFTRPIVPFVIRARARQRNVDHRPGIWGGDQKTCEKIEVIDGAQIPHEGDSDTP